jgi:CheY-like chemotaxis protein
MGEGSEFRFTIPLPVAPDAANAGDVFDTTIGDGREPSPSFYVLLVEDAAVNQWVIRRILESLGHTVEVVDNGRAAIESFRKRAPDIVLMDVQLPGMDGTVATTHLRDLEAGGAVRVPIIALSGHGMPNEVDRCMRVGMNGHLLKPVSAATLQQAMLRAWHHRERVPRVQRLSVDAAS